MEIVIPLVLVLGLVFGATILLLRWQLRRVGRRWEAEGIEMVRGPVSINYRGHERGGVPLRGNGVMVLTPDDLRVVRLAPYREFVVPLAQVTGVEVKRSWRGGYRPGWPVLVVRYEDAEGADAIGVHVRDVPGWTQAIAEAASVPVPDGSAPE